MEKKERNYKVTINDVTGSCNTSLFKKMAEKGDLTAEKIIDNVGKIVTITGYACCTINFDEKEFDINYYNTESGLISSGSEIFLESVTDYIGEVNTFKIVKIKTKKGSTYKAVPIIVNDQTGEIEE